MVNAAIKVAPDFTFPFWCAMSESAPVLLHNEHYPTSTSVDAFRHRIALVQQRIDQACLRNGRASGDVRLLVVSKTFGTDRIRLAYQAGCRVLGENKVQEAERKYEELHEELPDLQWSVIGHLQSNKAKSVARFAAEFQALDKLKTAETLDRRLQIEGRSLDVFVQVNTSGEASKFGLPPEEVHDFVRALPQFSALRVKGFMTLALMDADPERVRPCFVLLRQLRDQIRNDIGHAQDMCELSMGMSGDYEIAIEEGATVVRVGQAIFGARSTPNNYYWPEAQLETP